MRSSTSGGSLTADGSACGPLQHGKAARHDAVCRVSTTCCPASCTWSSLRLGKGGAGVLRLEPVHHGLDALDVLVADVVLRAQRRRDVDVGDVVAGRGVDAVERLEEHPFLPQIRGDPVEARARVAGEAVGEPALVVARVGVIEAGLAFEDGLAARRAPAAPARPPAWRCALPRPRAARGRRCGRLRDCPPRGSRRARSCCSPGPRQGAGSSRRRRPGRRCRTPARRGSRATSPSE